MTKFPPHPKASSSPKNSKNPNQKGCRHRSLAASPLCRIEQCEHGTVHLNLGDLTLRMGATELLQLSDTLGLAASRLERPRHLC